jgi:hypothetical protein
MFKEVNDWGEFICEAKQSHSSQRIETEFWWILFDAFEIVLFRLNRRNLAFSHEVVKSVARSLFDCDISIQERTKQVSPENIQVRVEWNTDKHTIASLEMSGQPFVEKVFSIRDFSNQDLTLRLVVRLSVQIKISVNFSRGKLCIFVVNLFIHP